MATKEVSPLAENMDKREKYLALSAKREANAVKAISLIGNLAAYDWNRPEVEKLIKRLQAEVFRAKDKFESKRKWNQEEA